MAHGIPPKVDPSFLQSPSTLSQPSTSNMNPSIKRKDRDKPEDAVRDIKRSKFESTENPLNLRDVSPYGREYKTLNYRILKYQPKNYNEIKYLIEKSSNQDINMINKFGYSPLMSAINKGLYDIAELLINCGADVNVLNSYNNETVLHYAAQDEKCNKILAFLIESGVEIDTKDRKGFTALHRAVIKNKLQNVKLLLNNGANPNTQNMDGYSPLHSATMNLNIEISKLLIEKDADLSLKTENGNTPFLTFIYKLQKKYKKCRINYSSEIIESFIKLYSRSITNTDSVEKTGFYKETILHNAISIDNVLIMKDLLSNQLINGLINNTDFHGRTVLTQSIYNKSKLEISCLLINNGSNCLTEHNGLSPIYAAIFQDKLPILKKMEDTGIDLTKNYKNYTFAIFNSAENCLEYLVSKKNPFSPNSTFTWITLQQLQKIKKLNLMKSRYNDPHMQEKSDNCLNIVYTAITDTSRKSPFNSDFNGWISSNLHHQLINNRHNVIESDEVSLIKHSCIECVVNDNVSQLEIYLSEIDVDFSDVNGDTLLHYAAICGHLHIIKLLIENYQANYEALNKYNATPLSIACKYGHLDIVEYLALKKVNINQAVPKSRSPLMNAIKHSQLYIADFLLKQPQIKLDEEDDLGNLAIHHCVTPSHYELVKKLLKNDNVNHKNNKGVTPLYLLMFFIKDHIYIQDHIPNLESTIEHFFKFSCSYGPSIMRVVAKIMNPSITKLFLKNNQWEAFHFKMLFEEQFDKIHDGNYHYYIEQNYKKCIELINDTIVKIEKIYCFFQSKITDLISHEKFIEFRKFYLSHHSKEFSKEGMLEFIFTKISSHKQFDKTNPQITKADLKFIMMYWDNNARTQQ